MSETDLYNQILSAHSRGPNRYFRINAGGIAWQGTVIEHSATRITLAHPRAIKLGFAGLSDLIGWTQQDGHAVFTAIECKSVRGRLSTEQAAFIALVRHCGGRAGIARNIEEAAQIIRGES